MAFVDWPDNASIGADDPLTYWPVMSERMDAERRSRQVYWHALPVGWEQLDYTAFLERRRQLIARVRAIPVTDAEIALYGTLHHGTQTNAAEPEPLLAAPTEHDDLGAHETSSQYYARMQSYARWQPESHLEATAEPAAAPEAHDTEPDLEP